MEHWEHAGNVIHARSVAEKNRIIEALAIGKAFAKPKVGFNYWKQSNGIRTQIPLNNYIIPTSFWSEYLTASEGERMGDWQEGNFSFRLRASGQIVSGNAGNVMLLIDGCLDRCDLAGSEQQPKTLKGRKPANWWPDFAEELATYIFEEGLPEGAASEGQSRMIEAVFARMVSSGKGEPSRTQVQPVVSAILKRCRSGPN